MKTNRIIRNLFILIILAINVGCDQVSKTIVRQRIEYNEKITVINDFVTLTKVENTGAFLSLGNHLTGIPYLILMIFLPSIVIGYALYYVLRSKTLTNLPITGICLGIGGGVGNILDRLLYGSVTDFLHFDFVIFQTGIVNMADISITLGFLILTYSLIKKGDLLPKTS